MKDDGFLWIGKIRGDRRTEHKGKNIEVRPQKDIGMHTAYDVVETPVMENKASEFTSSFNTFSTEVTPMKLPVTSPVLTEPDWMSPKLDEPTLTWSAPVVERKAEEDEKTKNPYTFGLVLTGGFLATATVVLALLRDE